MRCLPSRFQNIEHHSTGFRLMSDDLATSPRPPQRKRNFRVGLQWQPSDLKPPRMDSLSETEMAKIARLPVGNQPGLSFCYLVQMLRSGVRKYQQ